MADHTEAGADRNSWLGVRRLQVRRQAARHLQLFTGLPEGAAAAQCEARAENAPAHCPREANGFAEPCARRGEVVALQAFESALTAKTAGLRVRPSLC